MVTQNADNKTDDTPKVDTPKVEPLKSDSDDPAIGDELDLDVAPTAKLADGGGAPVFMGAPLVRGIPVVVPVVDGVAQGQDLVWGVAVAAPVVPGTPEMIANAQADLQVEDKSWKKGDLRSVHQLPNGEVHLDFVDADGSVRVERHSDYDGRKFLRVQRALTESRSAGTKAAKKEFGKETRIKDPNDLDDE